MQNDQATAKAMLQNGFSVEDVAMSFTPPKPISLIEEWKGTMTQFEIEGTALTVLAITKASEILATEGVNNASLGKGVQSLAAQVIQLLENNINNADVAMIVNIHSKTIANIAKALQDTGSGDDAELGEGFLRFKKLQKS